jgi:long-subunit acyl-CoA synthetase (AMP-forming)
LRFQELVASTPGVRKTRDHACSDPAIVEKALAILIRQGRTSGLQRFEIPKAVYLAHEPWTPESGLVTAAFKLKRKPIQTRFQREINDMYDAFERPANSVGLRFEEAKTNGERKANFNQIGAQREV